jgi:cell fate (sporulation/competence/biofilm development) regulator YlbF (YheA/YmcA/DUF963 family)
MNAVSPAPTQTAVDTRQAARDFATSLAETPEFNRLEQAALALEQDSAAQQAMTAFQNKQQSLQMLLQLNAVSHDDQAELDRLYRAMLEQPAVAAYLQAQANVTALCQVAANLLSEKIELNFVSACRPSGCCS